MNYKFPMIREFSDVEPYIDEEKGFYVANKGEYSVVNYHFATDKTFPPIETRAEAIQREFRGLVFCNKTGVILRRPFHKFFNYGEKEETRQINGNLGHVVENKLDGSLIAPFILPSTDEIIWGSKAVDINFHEMVKEFVNKSNLPYETFARHVINLHVSPNFEFCTNKNRVVINYDEDHMTLLAFRDFFNGSYAPHEWVKAPAMAWNIPMNEVFDFDGMDISQISEEISSKVDLEGAVLHFSDGHRIKIKSDWYLQLHKVKSYFDYEKDVVKLILEENSDDLIHLLSDNQKERFKKFERSLFVHVDNLTNLFRAVSMQVKENQLSRKEFSLQFVDIGFLRSIIFANFDDILAYADHFGFDKYKEIVVDSMIRFTSSHSKWRDFKTQHGINLDW